MAKALINKGVSIKADNPKDPYIMDNSSINGIVNSNTTFGKSLALDSNGLKLKGVNGAVKSTVSIAQPYKEEAVNIYGEVPMDFNYTDSYWFYNSEDFEFSFEVGKCYKFYTIDTIHAFDTITIVDTHSNAVITVDCTGISDYISDIYVEITAISGDNITATGYTTAPTEKVYYNRELKLGDTIKVESNTIDANLPSYGNNLQLDTTTNTVNAVNLCYLYTVSQFEVDQRYISIDPSASDIAIALLNQPLVQGTYYKLQVINSDLYASNTVTAVDSSDSSITFSIDCSGINHTISENDYLYIYVDSIDDSHYTCTGYDSADVNTDYKKAIKVGDGLTIDSDTLKVTLPNSDSRFFEVTKDQHGNYHLEDASAVTTWINGGADRNTYFYEYAASHPNNERIVYQFFGKKENPYGGSLYCFYCLDGEADWNQFTIGTLTYKMLTLDDNGFVSSWSKTL